MTQNLHPAAAFELAFVHIHEDFEFPWQEGVSRAATLHHLANQAIEAVEHDFELDQIFAHGISIGGKRLKP
ncbi:MAG TPA: hypothetical protein VHW24_08170 [Bryobacteraceae bacterium]|nr:hypothetical protein [Bryobacteraceae bacterium]